MSLNMKEIINVSLILLLLVLCLLTGYAQSPFRFLYFPLFCIIALRTTLPALLTAGFAFTTMFAFMAFYRRPPAGEYLSLFVEVVSFFLFTVAAALLVKGGEAAKKTGAKSAATFQLVSSELKNKSQELENALDALSKTHRQILEAARTRNRFLIGISRELSEPLAVIRSHREKLLDVVNSDKGALSESVQAICDQGQRIFQLVSGHLDLLMKATVNSSLSSYPLNPALLVEVGIKVVSPMADRKGISLVPHLPEGLPLVKGDQNQLTQVIVDLLSNAIKNKSAGVINTGARQEGNMVEFFVEGATSGVSIEPEGNPDRPDCLDLDIALTRRIVELHGGRSRVENAQANEGLFYFTIPVYAAAEESAPPVPLHKEKGGTELKSDPILVQSESIVFRQTLRKLLENLGYKTVGADTPGRGLEVAAELKPSLIISDNLEGIGDFLKLGNWARDAGVNILLATLYIDPVSGEPGLVASGYLRKPFDRFQIFSTIEGSVINGGRLFIISPDREEAGRLNSLLTGDGYSCELYMNEAEALRAMQASTPDGVIIGSFPSTRHEDVIAALKKAPCLGGVPFFLLEGEGCARFAIAATLDPASHPDRGKALSPLITMIGKSLRERDARGIIG